MRVFIGALIGAAASLIGARKQKKEQSKINAQARVDRANQFVDLREAAVKAGFNPLTVLRATGGAGFGPMNEQASTNGLLASADFLAAATDGFVNRKYDAALRAAQLESVKLSNYAQGMQIGLLEAGGSIGTYGSGGGPVSYAGPRVSPGGMEQRGPWAGDVPSIDGWGLETGSYFHPRFKASGGLLAYGVSELGLSSPDMNPVTGQPLSKGAKKGGQTWRDLFGGLTDGVMGAPVVMEAFWDRIYPGADFGRLPTFAPSGFPTGGGKSGGRF